MEESKFQFQIRIDKYTREKIDYITETVLSFYDIDIDAIRGKDRNSDMIMMRGVMMYFIRFYTGISFEDIGFALRKEHTTVMNAIKSMIANASYNYSLLHDLRSINNDFSVIGMKMKIGNTGHIDQLMMDFYISSIESNIEIIPGKPDPRLYLRIKNGRTKLPNGAVRDYIVQLEKYIMKLEFELKRRMSDF